MKGRLLREETVGGDTGEEIDQEVGKRAMAGVFNDTKWLGQFCNRGGVNIPVGDRRIRDLLTQHHLSIADTKVPTPHQNMRTEYPNQVHFVDPSVALIYFAPGSGTQRIVEGRQRVLQEQGFLRWRKIEMLALCAY
jgi:hypothetical protein